MKPGITGLWQVRARRDPDFDRWVEADLEYIDRWSLWLDLKILVRTIPAALGGPMTSRTRAHHRHHRPGRLVPRRAAARQGLRGPRPDPPLELVLDRRIDHLYHDPHERASALFLHYADLTDSSSLIGHLHRDQARRGLQPRRPEPREGQLRDARVHRRHGGMGTLRLLEAIRTADWPIRFYQAGSQRDVRRRSPRRRRRRRRRSTRAARTRSRRSSRTG